MIIKFSPPDITDAEIEEVIDTLRSGWITTGPKTKSFENEIAKFCGTNKAVCLNSATAGLELILRVLGIGNGDEVITSAYTYTASASVISHVGAKIVLCDTAKDSYEMDYDNLAALITDKTKAIISIDIGGKICDYSRLYEIASNAKSLFSPSNAIQEDIGRIALIGDAAHSFGAELNGKRSGNFADFTSFSFHAVKNLTTAEGGAVVWNPSLALDDEKVYRQFMLWSLHGQSKDALAKTKAGAWEYDIQLLGHKCNMTDIMASIGLVQLRRYDRLLMRREEIINIYDNFLKGSDILTLPHYGSDFRSSGHLYLTRINDYSESQRNDLIIRMAEHGVPTNVHYKPLPMHTAYRELGFDIKEFPNAYNQYRNEITLPLHTLLTDNQAEYVVETLLKSTREV